MVVRARVSIRVIGALTAVGVVATTFLIAPDERRPAQEPALRAAFGEPIAAVSYRNDQGGATILTLDGEANVRVCLRGSRNIEVAEVARGSILFLNTDLFVLPLLCTGKPRRVAALADLAGSDRSGDPHLTCPRFASDARMITVNVVQRAGSPTPCNWAGQSQIWVGRVDGSGWRRVGPGMGRGWIDDRHVLVDGIWDPHAIDVQTGRIQFLEVPHQWLGARSADGTRVVYDEDGGGVFRSASVRPGDVVRRPDGKPTTLFLDRTTGTIRPVKLPASMHRIWIKMTSLWNPGGGRFVSDDADSYQAQLSRQGAGRLPRTIRIPVYDGEMTPLNAFLFDKADFGIEDVRIGWLDAHRVVIGSPRGLALGDVETGELKPIAIPDLKREPFLVGSALIVFTDAQREGIAASEPTLVPRDRLPQFRDRASRISFSVPSSWRVQRCRCAAGRNEQGWVAFGRSDVRQEIHFYGMTFTSTSASLTATRRKLVRDRKVVRKFGGGRSDSRRTVGGVSFEVIRIAENDERGYTLLLGRAAGRTYVFEVGGDPDEDPSLGVILQTIRFG